MVARRTVWLRVAAIAALLAYAAAPRQADLRRFDPADMASPGTTGQTSKRNCARLYQQLKLAIGPPAWSTGEPSCRTKKEKPRT